MKRQTSLIIKATFSCFFCTVSLLASAQTNADGSMPQYHFGSFSESTIRMKNGQIQTQNMNYNTITGKMVFIKGEKYYDLTNPEMVDTITIEGSKFVPVGKDFYEVIRKGVYSYYVQNVGNLTQPGKPVGYGGTSQLSASNYVSTAKLDGMQWNLTLPSDFAVNLSEVYWIRKGSDWFDFVTEKQLLKLFPDKASQMKEFIKANKVKLDRKETMIKLIDYLNTL
jgi:hypothetical protein